MRANWLPLRGWRARSCRTLNAKLRALLEADQEERRRGLGPESVQRDEERLKRVEVLLAEGAVLTGEDHYAAAMIFQHGRTRENHWQAHELALLGMKLGYEPARWLAAAAYDRWLSDAGLPQKFGTQYRSEGGSWSLLPVDPSTTDEERARWDVPPIAAARARAEEMTRRSPPPSGRGMAPNRILLRCPNCGADKAYTLVLERGDVRARDAEGSEEVRLPGTILWSCPSCQVAQAAQVEIPANVGRGGS